MTITNTNPGWVNADGLRVKFPQDHLVKGKAGEYNHLTSTHVSEFDIAYTDFNLGTSDTAVYILDYDTVLPNGAVVEKIVTKVGTAFTSGGAVTFNVGLVARSDFTTITDADGLLTTVALSTINADGEITEYIVGTSGSGALLGTALAVDNLLSVNVETSTFTAGTMKLYVYWRTAA